MKKIIVGILLLVLLAGLVVYYRTLNTINSQKIPVPNTSGSSQTTPTTKKEDFAVLAENLDTPWAIAFLPDNQVLFTERPGRLHIVNSEWENAVDPIQIEDAKEIGEGGLLGVAADPDFSTNHFIYLYYTYQSAANGNTLNHLVRFKLENNSLADKTILIDGVPGSSNHDGGRIAFGPDKLLYITTGDAEVPSRAQDTKSLAGKILRVTSDGKPAPGNPFQNEVYSYGHRNPQGLAWDDAGNLWETEHGRSGVTSGLDEVNRIELGKNYGWPTIEGTNTKDGMVTPVINSGASTTWAPSGEAIIGNTLYFAGLRGQSLYSASLQGESATLSKAHLINQYGRLRVVVVGPDGMLYVSTSNQDGRGNPSATDDKIFRINPSTL